MLEVIIRLRCSRTLRATVYANMFQEGRVVENLFPCNTQYLRKLQVRKCAGEEKVGSHLLSAASPGKSDNIIIFSECD